MLLYSKLFASRFQASILIPRTPTAMALHERMFDPPGVEFHRRIFPWTVALDDRLWHMLQVRIDDLRTGTAEVLRRYASVGTRANQHADSGKYVWTGSYVQSFWASHSDVVVPRCVYVPERKRIEWAETPEEYVINTIREIHRRVTGVESEAKNRDAKTITNPETLGKLFEAEGYALVKQEQPKSE